MPISRALLILSLLVLGCGGKRQVLAPASEAAAHAPSMQLQPVSLPPAPGTTRVRRADGTTMAWIAPGEFLMGSDGSPYPAERPEHVVDLGGYWIDRLELSNARYRRCVAAGICAESAALTDRYRSGDRQPALVSWRDAAAYCEWVGARLPTEAEWEKAARGRDGRLWPWGHDFDASRANLSGDEDGFQHTAPVGSFPSGASPYGLLDMAGNAAEWVSDSWAPGYYETSPAADPPGPAAGEQRVYRSTIANGGGRSEKTRTVARFGGRPDWEHGFRCATSDRAPARLRQTAAARSPLGRVVPPALVPAAAAATGLSLLALGNLLSGLGLKIVRSMVSDKVVARFQRPDIDPEFRGFRLGGVRFKLREWLAILAAASVFAASLSYLYLQPEAPVIGFVALTTTVNMLVYSSRHLTRILLDRRYGIHTEYKMWTWGVFITALSGYLGNTFGLAGYVAGGGSRYSGRVNYLCNAVSFATFVVFWMLNRLEPSVPFQMVMLLAISITFLQMLPFRPFDGRSIYEWKRQLWWPSFVPLTVLYVLTMLVLKS